MIAEPHVWKRWQRSVRRRIKASAELRLEYRRTRGLRKRSHTWTRLRFLAPLALAIALLSGEVPTGSLLNVLLFWTAMLTLIRTQFVASVFSNPRSLAVLFLWPMTDDEAFARLRKIVLKSSLWLAVDWLVFGGILAWQTGDLLLAAAAVVLAAGQWAASLGLALWLALKWPRFPYSWFSAPFGLAIWVALNTHDHPDLFTPYVEALWRALYVATPGGWLAQGWNNFADGHPLGPSVLFGVSSAAGFTVFKGAQATRKAFNLEKLFDYEESAVGDTADSAPETASSQIANEAQIEAPRHGLREETNPLHREHARAHAAVALTAPPGQRLSARGPVERALSWFLTPRQRTLVDFMRPSGKPWLRRWLIACGVLVVAFVLSNSPTPFAAVPAVVVALCYALPVTGGRWMGFQALRVFQTQIGITAYVPASFGELARLLLKINALQCLAAFPLVLIAMHIGFAPDVLPVDELLDKSVRVLGLVLAAQPIWIITKFSPNTNDSAGRWYFVTGLLIVLILAVIIGISLTATLFIAKNLLVAAGCLLALNAISHAFLVLYALAWGRGWFDLIAKQK